MQKVNISITHAKVAAGRQAQQTVTVYCILYTYRASALFNASTLIQQAGSLSRMADMQSHLISRRCLQVMMLLMLRCGYEAACHLLYKKHQTELLRHKLRHLTCKRTPSNETRRLRTISEMAHASCARLTALTVELIQQSKHLQLALRPLFYFHAGGDLTSSA